jgi:hypothetical protein
MGRPLSRITPVGPVGAYKTYGLTMPRQTHTRAATCAEVECAAYGGGWAVTVAAGSDDEALVRRAGRHFLPPESQPGGFLRFVFPAGQPCFRSDTHRVPLDRPALYVVRGGDWRGNTGVIRHHVSGADWVDDFREHQDKIITAIGQG